MVRGQNQQAAGGLGDHGLVHVRKHLAHHGAAVHHAVFADGGAAGEGEDIGHRSTDGSLHHHGLADLAGHGEVAMRDGLAVHSMGNVEEGFGVAHHSAHMQGQTALRNDAAESFVHQNLFVTGRIEILELEGFESTGSVTSHGFTHGLHGLGMLTLEADNALLGFRAFHHGLEAADHGVDFLFHDMRIAVEERFARSAVHQHSIHFGIGFDVRRQTCAASADNAGLPYLVNNRVSHRSIPLSECGPCA